MAERSIFWLLLRSMLFIFGAVFIVMLQINPNDFSSNNMFFQHTIFAWCAAFVNRRPGSANDLCVFFVALIYAIYIDEGLALGATALVLFVGILRYMRAYTVNSIFAFELMLTSAIYLLVITLKNILLFGFLAPHFTLYQLMILSISFVLTYPILNLIIVIFVRSRKDQELAI